MCVWHQRYPGSEEEVESLFWAWSLRALWGFTRFFLCLRKTRLPTCSSLLTGLPEVPLVFLKISTHALRMPHGALCENILLLTFQKVFAIWILLLWHYSSAFMKWNKKNRAESCVRCRHVSPNKDLLTNKQTAVELTERIQRTILSARSSVRLGTAHRFPINMWLKYR